MYGLCDCNNFYASCERIFRPDLEKKPIIVLSNNDGCVVARSNEAKKAGIAMGVPVYQVRNIISEKNISIFSANFALYGDISQRVMTTLKSFLPSLEIYSIDEAFFDLSGINNPVSLGETLVKTIRQNIGIPVSIGIAPTKTLAKIASKLAKSYPKLNGCCYMHRPEDIKKVLSKFPLNDIWGIGRKHWKKFSSMGILTAQQFVDLPQEMIQGMMGITGVRTWKELHGISCIAYDSNPEKKQQISISRTFPKEIYNKDELETILSEFVIRAGEKMRGQNSSCLEVGIFIYTNRYHINDIQHCESILYTFPEYTNDSMALSKQVRILLDQIYRKNFGYKRAGIWLSHFIQTNKIEHSLFEEKELTEKNQKLMETLDKMNKTYGKNTIKLGSEAKESFKMNREHLSNRYTTDWDELLTVKA